MENDFGKDHVPAQHTGTEMNAVEKIELGLKRKPYIFLKSLKSVYWMLIAGQKLQMFQCLHFL